MIYSLSQARFVLVALLALVCAAGAKAEHVNTLGSGASRGATEQPKAQGAAGGAQGAGGGQGGGPTYQKNETTKELAKAAEKYQAQINESTKSAQASIKEQTQSFLKSIDGLKVAEPELNKDLVKSSTDVAAFDSKKATSQADDVIGAIKARADTQVEYMKALATRYAPNDSNPPPAKPQQPSMLEKIRGLASNRPAFTGDPLELAMGTDPKGGKTSTPGALSAAPGAAAMAAALGGGGPTRQHGGGGFQRGFTSGVYNIPPGVRLDP